MVSQNTPKMDGLYQKILLEWMIQGYPIYRNNPVIGYEEHDYDEQYGIIQSINARKLFSDDWIRGKSLRLHIFQFHSRKCSETAGNHRTKW